MALATGQSSVSASQRALLSRAIAARKPKAAAPAPFSPAAPSAGSAPISTSMLYPYNPIKIGVPTAKAAQSNPPAAPVKAATAPAPAPVKSQVPAKPAAAPVIDNRVPAPTATYSAAAAPVKPSAFQEKTWNDAASLFEDMKSNLSVDELKSINDRFKSAKTAQERDLLTQEAKKAVNAKLASKFVPAAPATKQEAAFEGMANLTDAEKLAQARQATYSQKNVEYENKQKAAYEALAGINEQYKANVLRTLGLRQDGTPDLSNTEGQYYKSKKLYDDLVTNNSEAFKTIRSQVEADLGGAGRQILIQAGLSGANMDPAAIGLKMGAAGQRALGLVNDAKQAMLKQEGAILQQKNSELAKLVSDGLISSEAYDKATAAAKAQYDANVYDNSLKLLEAAFGQQEVANAYDAQNRKERVNTINSALTQLGLTQSQSNELLSSFNFRRDPNGNLETPERALLRLAEWTKSDVNSINPQFLPKDASEEAAWRKFQSYIRSAEQRSAAKAAFENQIELLKAQKSGSSGSGAVELPDAQAILLRGALSSGGANVSDQEAKTYGGSIISALAAPDAGTKGVNVQLPSGTKIVVPPSSVMQVLNAWKSGLGSAVAQ